MWRHWMKGWFTSGVGWSGTHKISSMHLKDAQFRAYELFISGIFHLVFQSTIDHGSLKLKRDTIGEGRWLYTELVEGRDRVSLILCVSHHVSAVLPKGHNLLIFVNTFLLKPQEQLTTKCLRLLTVFFSSVLTGIFRSIINRFCLLSWRRDCKVMCLDGNDVGSTFLITVPWV